MCAWSVYGHVPRDSSGLLGFPFPGEILCKRIRGYLVTENCYNIIHFLNLWWITLRMVWYNLYEWGVLIYLYILLVYFILVLVLQIVLKTDPLHTLPSIIYVDVILCQLFHHDIFSNDPSLMFLRVLPTCLRKRFDTSATSFILLPLLKL